MNLPATLTKKDWDKKKGLLAKVQTSTGIGDLLKKLESAYSGINWEAFDKKRAVKESHRDFGAFEGLYRVARSEATKAKKVTDLLEEIETAAAKYKSSIKQCVEVLSTAKSFHSEIDEVTFMDWDDERISLKEAQEELDWYIEARAEALKVAKLLRKKYEKDASTAAETLKEMHKAADDIASETVAEEQKKQLVENVADWATQIRELFQADQDEYNDKFAKDKDMEKQRRSPKHDIKEDLDKAGGAFELQMVEVDAILKSLRQLEQARGEAEGIVDEVRDVFEASTRSNSEWKASLNRTVQELAEIMKSVREAREVLAGKERQMRESYLPTLKDPKITQENKQQKKLVLKSLIKEVDKQYGKFDIAVTRFTAKAKRVEKVPPQMAEDKLVKPLVAAFATLNKLIAEEKRLGKENVEQFKKLAMEALSL